MVEEDSGAVAGEAISGITTAMDVMDMEVARADVVGGGDRKVDRLTRGLALATERTETGTKIRISGPQLRYHPRRERLSSCQVCDGPPPTQVENNRP